MTQENQATMTAAIKSAVTDAIQQRDRESSERHQKTMAKELDMERAAKKLLSFRDIVLAIGFFAALIGGGTLTVNELQEKPSNAEMATAIDDRVSPLEQLVEPMEQAVAVLTGNVARMKKLQELQLIQADYHQSVLDCRARRCKRPPNEPPELKAMKAKLMANTTASKKASKQ